MGMPYSVVTAQQACSTEMVRLERPHGHRSLDRDVMCSKPTDDAVSNLGLGKFVYPMLPLSLSLSGCF